MRELDSLLIFCLSAVVFAPSFLEDFSSMAALYGIMTGISVLYGLGYLRGQTEARPPVGPGAVPRVGGRAGTVGPGGLCGHDVRADYRGHDSR